MKKSNLALLLIVFLFFFILACDKTKSLHPSILSKSSVSDTSKLKPDYLSGSCPYPCTDTRCKAFASGYCGTPTAPDTVTVITNSNNQYDYIGSYHNKILNYTLSKINASTPQSYAYIQSNDNVYLKKLGYDTVQANSIVNTSLQYGYYSEPDTAYANNPSSLITKIHNDGNIDSYTASYMNSIIGYFTSDIGSNTPSSSIYTQFANHVISIENTAKSDTRITSIELQYILTEGSVARYSAAYWANYYIENLSGAGVDAVNKNSKQLNGIYSKGKVIDKVAPKPSYNWKMVGVTDVAAAVGGAVTGAIASCATGVGCVVSPAAAGIGAVSAGVGGSVAQAIIELYNWW